MDVVQEAMLEMLPPLAASEPATEEATSGEVVFETTVAVKGGVMSVEVYQTSVGPVLQLQATGGARKPAPIKLDRFQARALVAALGGADSVIGGGL